MPGCSAGAFCRVSLLSKFTLHCRASQRLQLVDLHKATYGLHQFEITMGSSERQIRAIKEGIQEEELLFSYFWVYPNVGKPASTRTLPYPVKGI